MTQPTLEQIKQEKEQITQAYLARGQEIARLAAEVARLENIVVVLQKQVEAAQPKEEGPATS